MAKRVLIVTDSLGRGDDELGKLLMKSYLYALARAGQRPAAVMLMNGGVRLACAGSPSLDDLALLVEAGVPVTACGTCLDYLGLTDTLAVGSIGTMPAVVDAMLSDDGVVTVG